MNSTYYCDKTQRQLHFVMYPFPERTSISVTGATLSGKSHWVFRLLRHKDDMFDSPPDKVLYCYGIDQPLYGEIERTLPFVTFHRGLPTEDLLTAFSSDSRCNLVILDDLMDRVTSSADMEALFVMGMHHRNLSVVYLNQNLFCKGKHSRTINVNTHIYVMMKNPRDISQLQCLARQAFLGKSGFIMKAFKDATSTPYGYLVLDLSPSAIEDYRVRTHIFPGEDTVVYQSL